MRDPVAPHRTEGAGSADGPLPHVPGALGGASHPVPWWAHGVAGFAGIVLGVVVLAYPDPSVKLLGILVGIDLLLVGISLIVRGTARGGDDTASGPGAILLGTLGLVAGLAAVRNPSASITLIVLAFAGFLIVDGALALARGLIREEGRWLSLARGTVFVAVGTTIISWPDVTVSTLAVLSGIALIFQGAFEILGAWLLRASRPEPAP